MSVFIIAEIGSVHDGSLGNARCLIDVAAEAGVNAAKFQTHIAEAETIRNAPMPPYFTGEPRFDYFTRTGFSYEQWRELQAHCFKKEIEFISSAFSTAAVELLERVGVGRYKIPSGEITNLPLLEQIAQTKKPVLVSSGMSTWTELDAAVNVFLKHHSNVTVLQCTSEYPCRYEDVGLNIMTEMKQRYGLAVGLSDHTLTPYASLAATVLGATVIEKHLTFSRSMYGSDARHSMEPQEMAALVEGIRSIEVMLAAPTDKDETAGRLTVMREVFQKSVVSAVEIPIGTTITAAMLAIKKPGTGISASQLNDVIGKVATRHLPSDTIIQNSDIL